MRTISPDIDRSHANSGSLNITLQQLRRLQPPVDALVFGALPVDQRLVELQQQLAKLDE